MPVCGNHIRCLALCAAISAQFASLSLQAADSDAGYEGWAFSTARSSLARDPVTSRNDTPWRSDPADRTTTSTAVAVPQGLQLSRTLDNGLALDAGLAQGQELDHQSTSLTDTDYRDAFLGVRYQGFTGQVWYLDEPRAEDGSQQQSLYYQAGWTTPVSDRFSVSLQMGQSYRRGMGFEHDYPDLSIAAEGNFAGYGLGIRLIDRSGMGFGEEDAGYSLIGSFSKPFP